MKSSKTILDRSAPSCLATRSSGNPSSSPINDLPTNSYELLHYKGVVLCLLLLTVNLPEKLTVTNLIQKYLTSRREKVRNQVFWDVIVLLGEWFLMIWTEVVPLHSWSSSSTHSSLQDEGTMILQNVGKEAPNDIASYQRRLQSSATLLWGPQILHKKVNIKHTV